MTIRLPQLSKCSLAVPGEQIWRERLWR